MPAPAGGRPGAAQLPPRGRVPPDERSRGDEVKYPTGALLLTLALGHGKPPAGAGRGRFRRAGRRTGLSGRAVVKLTTFLRS